MDTPSESTPITTPITTPIVKKDHSKIPTRKGRKNRITANNGIKQIYEYYKNTTVKDIQQPYNVFRSVLKDLNIAISNKILLNSEDIHLPCGLGRIRIKKQKMNFSNKKARLFVDWNKSRKLKKTIYHTNDHRNGSKYRWHWHKRTNLFFNLKLKPYAFIPSRDNKRALAAILKNNKDIDYFN